MLSVDNEKGLVVIFSPVGAGIKDIFFDNIKMIVTPENSVSFLEPVNTLGKTREILLEDLKYSFNGKEFIKDKTYVTSNYVFQPKVCMDKNFFSISYVFNKKKLKDGLPNNITYYVSYSMSGQSNELLIDYRVISDKPTPISITSNLMFNLGAKINDLSLTVPSYKRLVEKEFVKVDKAFDFQKGKSLINGINKGEGYSDYFELSTSDDPIIIKNDKYQLNILTNYNYVFVDSDNMNSNRGIIVSPIDNPINIPVTGNNKSEYYHREILLNFIKFR